MDLVAQVAEVAAITSSSSSSSSGPPVAVAAQKAAGAVQLAGKSRWDAAFPCRVKCIFWKLSFGVSVLLNFPFNIVGTI